MIEMTYKLAMAAGRDAANRQMRAAGRSAWNEDDCALACATFDRLYGRVMLTADGPKRLANVDATV
jgi:hypothetical protein